MGARSYRRIVPRAVGAVRLRALPPLFIAVVSPCRCEPLRAGCCGGVKCFVGVSLSSSVSTERGLVPDRVIVGGGGRPRT